MSLCTTPQTKTCAQQKYKHMDTVYVIVWRVYHGSTELPPCMDNIRSCFKHYTHVESDGQCSTRKQHIFHLLSARKQNTHFREVEDVAHPPVLDSEGQQRKHVQMVCLSKLD